MKTWFNTLIEDMRLEQLRVLRSQIRQCALNARNAKEMAVICAKFAKGD
jgi:hypothetical protein